MCLYLFVHICVRVHLYIYIYVYMYIHIYIHYITVSFDMQYLHAIHNTISYNIENLRMSGL